MARTSHSDLESYFKQYNRGLTISGALVVFFTFIIREQLRDRYKDLANSISSAETTFALNHKSDITNARLRDLKQDLGGILTGPSSKRTKEVELEHDSFIAYQSVEEGFIDDSIGYDHSVTLASKLRLSPHLKDTMYNLKAELIADMDYRNDFQEYVTALSFRSEKEMQAARAKMDADATSEIKHFGYGPLSLRLQDFEREVLQEGSIEKEKADRLASRTNLASIFAYVFGWVFGLLGKLYGGREIDGGD